jgi:parvulin-like peptidyl-prolyl isomerase
VHIVKGTEDTLWNAQAAETIRHWKFLPAMSDGKPVQMWFHLQTNVHFARPVNFTLAQIVCNSQKDADSVYTALEHGNSFTELAKTYSRDSASRVNDGTMGMMNIYALPQELRRPIEDLSVNEYTEPIGYGNLFFIFKRLPQ